MVVQRRDIRVAVALGATAVVAGGSWAAALASGPTGSAAASHTASLRAKANVWRFNKRSLTVAHGRVTIRMFNPSSTSHGIAVEGHGVDKDGKIVGKGRTSVLGVRLKKGTYEFYCPVPGHKEAGMEGKLHVT
jgi:plastocyanin